MVLWADASKKSDEVGTMSLVDFETPMLTDIAQSDRSSAELGVM